MALTDKLSAIGTAIRNKTGKTALMTLDEMPTEIAGISGGNEPTDADLTISGNCSYMFAYGQWDWFINKYGNRITTENISTANQMFNNSNVSIIPFELNFSQTGNYSTSYLFNDCGNLTSVPKINNCATSECNYIFNYCSRLRYLPDDIATWFDWSYIDGLTSQYSGSRCSSFSHCHSLRSVPMSFLAHGNPVATYSYSIYYYGFQDCFVLDELLNLPNPHYNATWTSNAFLYTFTNCDRLKNLTFALNPETNAPYVVKWKNQTIDLSGQIGRGSSRNSFTSYNSGITADKEVKDDATYQALKNDPDWFTIKAEYSRYNHDSAVATINSLPDASAYITANGGTNTIKFLGMHGSSTDGGAISNLTAEEIAVASAKGWTVSLT